MFVTINNHNAVTQRNRVKQGCSCDGLKIALTTAHSCFGKHVYWSKAISPYIA